MHLSLISSSNLENLCIGMLILFLPAAKPSVRSISYNSPSPSSPLSPRINKIGQVGASNDMATYVIEVTDLKSEVRHDLRGCFEAVVTSEAAKTVHTI